MPVNVVMPQMGESVAEGTVVRWIKKVGDNVDRDEPLFEISTDKVDAEIPSPAAGTLSAIHVKEGETVPVDTRGRPDRPGRRSRRLAAPAAPASSAPARRSPPRRRRRRHPPHPPPPKRLRPRRRRPMARRDDRSRSAEAATLERRRAHRVRRRIRLVDSVAAHAGPNGYASAASAPAAHAGLPRRHDARRTAASAFVAARAQDRERAQRRHLADLRLGHQRTRHQEGHPRLHRASSRRGRAGAPAPPRARRTPRRRCTFRRTRRANASKSCR